MRCSVFVNDEDVAGWKAGSSVAYCERCFEEKMTKEMNHKDVAHEENFQKQTSGAKIQEAGQSAKPPSLKSPGGGVLPQILDRGVPRRF